MRHNLTNIINEHGGYWAYENLTDFYYLVNPYFPTKTLVKTIAKKQKELICNYPAGRTVVDNLAAKLYNLQPEDIVVGNGASELIELLCKQLTGTTGLISPTFNEYKARSTAYIEFKALQYTADDIIAFFSHKINNLILVNPQLHTGLYLQQNDILKLINWCKQENIVLVLDESFIDFSDFSFAFNLTELDLYNNLFIIKSLSKTFGVPGLRLGILASKQHDIIKAIKAEIPIWNISSIAQYFLEILPEYKLDFKNSIEKLAKIRLWFKHKLSAISEFDVMHSSANYFLISLKTIDSTQFCQAMLNSGIILRDLKPKLGGNCIRVSIRNKADNKLFLAKAKQIIKKLKLHEN